jgi:ferredoxin-NADP reductase
MILNILDNELPYRFTLIYSNSYVDDVIYQQELRELVARSDQLSMTDMITRPPAGYQGASGRLDSARLQSILGGDLEDLAKKMYYICGPTPFNDRCLVLLKQLGVPARRIKVEANGAPKRPDQQAGWPAHISLQDEVTVTVQGKGSFRTKVGEPLLNALERNGYGAENACRSGECSLCRIKLVDGLVFNPQEAHLRKSDRHFNWIYSCVAFPLEDIVVSL